ncbi:hypothetical protein BACPU_19860 [Bacillus pumilus]|nr:hypothetical protein BACPU_19860 [Bacillus pumilus]
MFPYTNQQPYDFQSFQQGPFPHPDMQQSQQPPEYFMPPYQAGMGQVPPAGYQPQPLFGYQEGYQSIQQPELVNQPQVQQAGMMPMQQPMNPYPLPRPQKQQPSQFKSVLSQFKKTNGQYDFNKMFDTAGQMMSAMNQVGSLAKGFTSIFKA